LKTIILLFLILLPCVGRSQSLPEKVTKIQLDLASAIERIGTLEKKLEKLEFSERDNSHVGQDTNSGKPSSEGVCNFAWELLGVHEFSLDSKRKWNLSIDIPVTKNVVQFYERVSLKNEINVSNDQIVFSSNIPELNSVKITEKTNIPFTFMSCDYVGYFTIGQSKPGSSIAFNSVGFAVFEPAPNED